ncbi:MAG: YkgJ family cysteine cluster protein, partial [Phycisphaerae bacterium]
MRLQVLDPSVRFGCGSCTACCDQPWRTLIEASKARALDEHDFSGYPKLAGKRFYSRSAISEKSRSGMSGGAASESKYVLAKGEGTRCLFLDRDGLCIIHKELGPEAKPNMCRQFPFLSARNWVEDRVSANFGCPSVQQSSGQSLTEQAGEIAGVVAVSDRPARPEAPVLLDIQRRLTQDEAAALLDRVMDLFEEGRSKDIWRAFAALCELLAEARDGGASSDSEDGQAVLARCTRDRDTSNDGVPEVRSYPEPTAAPMPVRLLFAATLYPDTVPPDAVHGMGLFRRLTLIPKL